MKTVALVGLAELTRNAVQQSKADEIWTLNWAYLYDFLPRIDRLFEMHPIWLFVNTTLPEWRKPRQHWEWLKKDRDYPVYMLANFSFIPNCIRYPIEDVVTDIFGENLLRGNQPTDFFSSSFDYLMGLAIHEGFDVIEIYGFEMGSDTEYRYQREGSAFFIGNAVARGITVKLQPNSVLLRNKRYGYEGGQMIFRQDIERLRDVFAARRRDSMSRLQHAEGKFSALDGKTVSQEEFLKLQKELDDAKSDALVASGAEQAAVYMLQEIDLEEPEIDLKNPIVTIPLKEEEYDHRDDWLI